MAGPETTTWVDLGKEGFEIRLASFEDSPGEPALVIQGASLLTSAEADALSSAGFVQMSGKRTLWARDGGTFKMREIRAAFPRMAAREMAFASTRMKVLGASPFAASRRPSPIETGSADLVRLHSDAPNLYQVRYVPGSRLGNPIAMVPVNLADSTRKALERVVASHGPIDDFVAKRLDMTLHELERALSPEQIDAVAVMLDALERNRAPILADQTGLGKGRVVAALMLAAAVAGKRIIFVTEKANLFSDIWRDVRDIGADSRLGVPFLLNAGSKIIDVTDGKLLFESWKDSEIARQVKACAMPEGFGSLFATYSQFNRAGSAKAAFLEAAADGAFVLLDETHNAGGDSNQQKVIDAATAGAYGIVRSSATFARRASGLLAYRGVLPPSLTMEDSADMLAAGGIELAEALSQYLSEDGVLVRREHDLSGLSIEVVVDDSRRERNRATADALAPVLARMAKLSRLVDDEIETRNENAQEAGGKASREKWYSANFGSRLSAIIRQFVTALSVDLCVDRCVSSLLAGEKPVVVIESTMEALMRSLAEEGEASGEDAADDEGAEEGAQPPDFRAALSMMLDRIMQMSVRRGKDDPEKVPVDDPFCVAEAEAIKRIIEAFPDLPLSPIDDIRDRIEAEGARLHAEGLIPKPWVADEISARKMRVTGGVYEAMKAADRNRTIVAFNSGDTDALVITRAASTGLSLHASEKVSDRRRRRMIELQIPANVVERVQFWGRVNRRGQVSVPGFETLCTGLPLQMRIMAMENRKVASLSANVSANAENASAMNVPDIIDGVGNEVAQRILEDQPRLAERMCIAMRVDPEAAAQELYFVNKLLQRLCLLPSDEQDTLFARLVSEYEDAVAGMKAKGRTPRGLREMEGVWTEVSREPYEAGDPADGPVFGRAVDLVTMEGTVERSPLAAARVAEMVQAARKRLGASSGNAAGPFFEAEAKAIRASRRKVLLGSLAGRFISVDSALASSGPNAVKAADARLSSLLETIKGTQPGMTMTVPGEDNEQKVAVIVDVRPPDADELHLPGRWSVRFAVPGEAHAKEISLATLSRDPAYEIHRPRPGSIPQPDLSPFDSAPRGLVKERRVFLDGNLVKAVAIATEVQAGSMVAYRTPDGRRLRSVLVNRRGRKALFDRSSKATTAADAASILRSGKVLFSKPADRVSGLVVRPDGRVYAADVPRGQEGKPIEEALSDRIGPFRPQGIYRSARIPPERLEDALEAILSANFPLHFDAPPKAAPAAAPPRGFGHQGRGFGPRR